MIQPRPVDTGDWVIAFGEERPGTGLRVLGESHPPFTHTGTDGIQIVFDGVLYSGKELGTEKLAPAPNPVEIVLALYRSFGERMLPRLRGLFALLVWDEARGTLLCARDHVGVYPLFWAAAGRELRVSISLEALLRDRHVSRAVNRTALAGYLSRRWPDVEETFFAGVRRVPPGHAMRVDRTGRRVYRYWHPAPAAGELQWVAEEELVQFDGLLNQAVSRYVSFGRPGIFLSGGLDSVTVAAVAASINRQRGELLPLALSLAFPHPDCNEEAVQQEVAAGLGLPQKLLPFAEAVGPRGLLLPALEMSSRLPAPLQNVWSPAYERLAAEGKVQGCDVILTGGGGDEWLSVTPVYAADLLRAGDMAGLYRLARSMQRSYRLPLVPLLRNLLWTNGTRLLLRSAWWRLRRQGDGIPGLSRPVEWLARSRQGRRWQHVPGWLIPDPDLRRELDGQAELRAERTMRERPQGSFYLSEMSEALNHVLPALEFEEIFENGRRLGVRILQPFWDAQLVEFLYRVPPSLLNKAGRSKGLVRATLHKRFPDLDFGNQKKIVSTDFFRSIMLSEGADAWRTLGGAPALAELGLVDATTLAAAVEEILTLRRGHQTSRIWEVLSLEAWLRPRL